jgi:hypothetical protein
MTSPVLLKASMIGVIVATAFSVGWLRLPE